MLQEINQQGGEAVEPFSLNVSDSASEAVGKIIKDRKLEGYALRIVASSCGCGDVRFGMGLDNNISETDTVIEVGKVKVVVAKESADRVHGLKIDFVDDPVQGAGFVIKKPRSSSTEGCCGGSGGGSCCS